MTKLFISEEYFSYVKQLSKSNGNYQDGEIEIILDPAKIQQTTEKQKRMLTEERIFRRRCYKI